MFRVHDKCLHEYRKFLFNSKQKEGKTFRRHEKSLSRKFGVKMFLLLENYGKFFILVGRRLYIVNNKMISCMQ